MNKKACLLSFLGGFLSLSIEVIYIRIMGFAFISLPQAFALTLALFLLGIAIGSLIGKRLCQREQASISNIGKLFLLAGLLDVFALLLILSLGGIAIIMWAILMTAIVRGIVFPVVHHLGTGENNSGIAISNVYFANVVGCTLSPILVGFYLFDVLNTQQSYVLIIALSFLVAFFCLKNKGLRLITMLLFLGSMAGIFAPEKLIHRLAIHSDARLETLIENKHGFIQVYDSLEQKGLKQVFGNNVYDGALNVDLINNANMIDRAYLLPVIAPEAKNILVIGLSTGSWVEVLTAVPTLENITVVELNPAYTKFAEFYPEMKHLLQDPRVNIITDDGRRWLARHPNRKFDYILMNTTWYWRAYSTNLLSQEFMTLARSHLNPNGFIAFNTTGFLDSFYTAKSVYPYAYLYKNFVIASLQPISAPTREMVQTTLGKMHWSYNNKPVFSSSSQLDLATEKLFETEFIPYSTLDLPQILRRSPEIITDINMIPEYKYGKFNHP